MHHTLQLKNLRLSKGITQQDLADSIDVSPLAISELENGLLKKITTFFNVTTSQLLGYPDDQIELLEIYNSLTGVNKGMLLERALCLSEGSENKVHLIDTEGNVIYVDFRS